MDRLGIYLDNTANKIKQISTGKSAPVTRKWEHPWFHLDRWEEAQIYLTEPEIRRLHRRFGHPQAHRLYRPKLPTALYANYPVFDDRRAQLCCRGQNCRRESDFAHLQQRGCVQGIVSLIFSGSHAAEVRTVC